MDLDFDISNTSSTKSFIRHSNYFKIKADDIVLISRMRNTRTMTCRKWKFEVMFLFNSLEKISVLLDKSYSACDAYKYGAYNQKLNSSDMVSNQDDGQVRNATQRVLQAKGAGGNGAITGHGVPNKGSEDESSLGIFNRLRSSHAYFAEIFFVNLIAAALNMSLMWRIIRRIILVLRYRMLKKQKLSTYRWMFRDKGENKISVS